MLSQHGTQAGGIRSRRRRPSGVLPGRGGNELPATVLEKLETDDDSAVSAVSCWEGSYLVDCGRLVLPLPIEQFECRIEYDSSQPDGTPRKLMDVGLINSAG